MRERQRARRGTQHGEDAPYRRTVGGVVQPGAAETARRSHGGQRRLARPLV
jgi:hypothetical protein